MQHSNNSWIRSCPARITSRSGGRPVRNCSRRCTRERMEWRYVRRITVGEIAGKGGGITDKEEWICFWCYAKLKLLWEAVNYIMQSLQPWVAWLSHSEWAIVYCCETFTFTKNRFRIFTKTQYFRWRICVTSWSDFDWSGRSHWEYSQRVCDWWRERRLRHMSKSDSSLYPYEKEKIWIKQILEEKIRGGKGDLEWAVGNLWLKQERKWIGVLSQQCHHDSWWINLEFNFTFCDMADCGCINRRLPFCLQHTDYTLDFFIKK